MTASDEVTTLLASLEAQRRHVLSIVEGLDEEQLQRAVLPSGWSCAGLVHHLALDDERFWFQAVLAGDKTAVEEVLSGEESAWQVPEDISGSDVIELYRREIERSNEVVAGLHAEHAPAWWPEFFGDFRLDTMRELILHVIVETATHAGHLDAARELIDGRLWLVLD